MSWLDNAQVKTVADKAAEAAQQAQDAINSEAERVLKESDWYVLRFLEKGTPIPTEITAARDAARPQIVRGKA